MIVIGVDIGLNGAICGLNTANGRALIFDMPTKNLPGKSMVRREIDPRELMGMIRALQGADQAAVAFAENVHTFPGVRNSPQSQGSLMEGRGILRAVLAIARIELTFVEPSTWKRHFGLKKDKDETTPAYKARSMQIARDLFPDAAQHLTRAKDHNRAESLLIAAYGKAQVH